MLARTISEISALGIGMRGTRPGLRILLYHSVGTSLAHDSYGISIAPQLFERQMAILANSEGVRVVGLFDDRRCGAALQVAVTFDDGYKDNLRVAAPILLKYRIPFTVFASTFFIRSGFQEYLTGSELGELADLPGATIGSHGGRHIPLAECDDDMLWHEVYESRRYLEETTGKTVTAISYPHGSVNRRVANAARRAGYTLGVCSRFGINEEDRDPFFLCRTEIVSGDGEKVFLQKLRGAWDWYRWRAPDPVYAQITHLPNRC